MSTLSAAQMFAKAQQGTPQAAPQPGAASAPSEQLVMPETPGPDVGAMGILPAQPFTRADAAADATPVSMKNAATERSMSANTADQADAATANAATKRSVLESYKAKEMEAAYKEHETAVAENNAKMEQIVNQGREAGQRQADRVRMAADAAANSDIKDFWADKSTLGKAMGIISQTLSGAANMLAGQPGAPTPLDKLIATDIEKQRLNMQNAQAGAGREESILNQLYKDTGSMLAAQSALTDAAYQKFATATKAMANRFGTAEAQQKAEEVIAEMMQKRAENQAKTAQYLTSAGIQQQGQFLDFQAKQEALQMQKMELGLKRIPIGFKGVQGSANIPDSDKTVLAKSMGSAATAIDLAEQIKQRSAPELFKWFGERFATEQDQTALAVELKKAAEFGGALSESEKQFLDALSGGQFLQRLGMQQGSKWYQDALTRLQNRIKLGTTKQLETWDGVKVGPDSPFYQEAPKAAK